MKRFKGILLLMSLLLVSCMRETVDLTPASYPEGTPVMMNIGFGYQDLLDVQIGTKAEASAADESRVHDLYVMLFDSGGNKFYGRFFTYEHLISSLSTLDSQSNEGWYVENSENTRGVVKISTEAKSNCTLVVIANISNTITSLDGRDPVDRLADVETLSQLNSVKVTLEQEVVNRADLFLMLGTKDGLNTGEMVWGELPSTYSSDYKVQLNALDAKVKFCIKYNSTNIDASKSSPRYWQVFNVPSSAYLMPRPETPVGVTFFNTEEAYFEGTEVDGNDDVWQVFSFYMIENRQSARASIEGLPTPDYYLRELQEKDFNADEVNGPWVYAPANGTYVQFDVVLGLTTAGIQNILDDPDMNHALTSEALFTIHLGDFTSSAGSSHDYDNYTVERSHAYTYYITIENSKKIYVEVKGDSQGIREDEPGQEGSLLLATDEIVNCDAHYEYHTFTFTYNEEMQERGVSWYVKTPFSEGGAQWNQTTGDWDFDCEDYLWVKFAVNSSDGSSYSENRQAFPGESQYDPAWDPESGTTPVLMDIHQLIKYIFYQTGRKKDGLSNDFKNDVIRVTAFIDEYYYEKDPRLGPAAPADPDLWRTFVNAKPRELHILSDAQYSADRHSDVITSSHSIIQQSIQTFYNIYSPDLTSLWGTEHVDEMSYYSRVDKDPGQSAWSWWPSGRAAPSGTITNEENGRVNTATLWGLNSSSAPRWDSFLDYNVDNVTPELQDDYQYLAYSCLTRNRDNNGNGVIDPEEVRWYTAAVNQIVGMWVGNESLSPSARIYQPRNAANTSNGLDWRSWVVASTATASNAVSNPVAIRAEEGCTKSKYAEYDWAGFNATQRDMVSSIRCVRNVGTFQSGGSTVDISYAPYDHQVDQYYEVAAGVDANGNALPNADGTYTVRFSRLNPKSIREYTADDLPYHQEYSQHNKVYLELVMQSRDNYVYADKSFPAEDEEVINNNITSSGHNSYCPTGYRLPNMTELLLMVALQPSSYWTSGTSYPCRSYYSYGAVGKGITGEDNKVGWAYSVGTGRMNMINQGTSLTGVRCVRDENCIGEITGKLMVPDGQTLRVGEDMTIKLNFTSQGSAIKYLALSLVYVGSDGRERTRDIDVSSVRLSGVSLREELVYTIPSDLPLLGSMSIRATVRNSAGITRTFEEPIKVYSPVFSSIRLLPCNYSESLPNPPFPVLLTAHSPSSDISSWQLTVKAPEGETTSVSLPTQAGDARYWTYTHDFTYTTGSLSTGIYEFWLDVTTSDGKTTRSESVSMEVLKVNYWPNPGNAYSEADDITNIWEAQKVDNVDFLAGDFVEANMDVHNCTYLEVMKEDDPTKRDDNRTLGRDNLISVGLTDTDHTLNMAVPNVVHVFYPAHDGGASSGQDWLRPNISRANGNSNGYNYNSFSPGSGTGFLAQGNYAKPNPSVYQHFRLDKSGIYWNSQAIDLSKWGGSNATDASASLGRVLAGNTLYIGATQGYHRSRAGYMFVRVVHNTSSSNPAGGNVSFEDPVNGGDL